MAETTVHGKDGSPWEITPEGHGIVEAISEPGIEHQSSGGNSWLFDSLEVSIDATDTMLFVKNNEDAPFKLNHAIINGSNVICEWTIAIGNLVTPPGGGVVVTPVNMNREFLGKSIDFSARSDETAVDQGTIVGRCKTPIDNTFVYPLSGFILNKGQYIQFDQVTGSDSGSIILYGHFDIS